MEIENWRRDICCHLLRTASRTPHALTPESHISNSDSDGLLGQPLALYSSFLEPLPKSRLRLCHTSRSQIFPSSSVHYAYLHLRVACRTRYLITPRPHVVAGALGKSVFRFGFGCVTLKLG